MKHGISCYIGPRYNDIPQKQPKSSYNGDHGAHQISFHEVVDLGKHLRFVTVYLMEQVHGS